MDVDPNPAELQEWLTPASRLQAMSADDATAFSSVRSFCLDAGAMPAEEGSSKVEGNAYRAMLKLRDRRCCVGQVQLDELAYSIAEGVKQATAKSMWFLEPTEEKLDDACGHKHPVHRIGFQASHAMFLTSTACQGQTLRAGVTIDCARKPKAKDTSREGMDDDTWWLHLYVMFSRATRYSSSI